MIKITSADINSPVFEEAVSILDEYTGFPRKQLFDFNKFKGKHESLKKQVSNKYNLLLRKYAVMIPIMVKDETTGKMVERKNPATGNIMLQPKGIMVNGKPQFELKDKYEFESAFRELMDEVHEIKINPFKCDDFIKAGLKPKHLRACRMLLEDADPEWFDDSVEEIIDMYDEAKPE